MKKFLTVVGNRPQLIKLDKTLKQVVVYTGQHYDKLLKDVFFTGLEIPKPDYDLNTTDLGEMISGIEKIIIAEKPDYVIVYGDTRSTYAGAMAAYHMNIPIVHIEAGCRSYNRSQIEERIRVIVDKISEIHFAPSANCCDNLEAEKIGGFVYNVGATQIDTMISTFPTKRPKDAYKYYVATIHRDFNVDNVQRLTTIVNAFKASGATIRFYAHPRTIKALQGYGLEIDTLKPLPYKKMINEIAFARAVITDSGGLQVESFFLNVPCITLRDETEWVETVEQGFNKLVPINEEAIVDAIKNVKRSAKTDWSVYGNGTAKQKIKAILENL